MGTKVITRATFMAGAFGLCLSTSLFLRADDPPAPASTPTPTLDPAPTAPSAPAATADPPPTPATAAPAPATSEPAPAPAAAPASAPAAAAAVTAEPPLTDKEKAEKAAMEKIAASLKWQTGKIVLKDGLATINLNEHFRFLNHEDTEKVRHDLWHNFSDPETLGMIFPADIGPLDDNSWAVIIRYEENGYVKDDDAASINYDDLLKQMKEEAREDSAQREKDGRPPIELIGWAAPPHYDKQAHKLYWAKELKIGDDSENTLNYNIRILGRRGVIFLNAVSGMSEFPTIDKKTPEIISMVDFQAGNTYAEFDPKIDKIAEGGLIALVAGGALAGAAKLGFFGLLWKYIIIGVLALKKVIVLVVVAIVGAVKALWGKITGKSDRNQ